MVQQTVHTTGVNWESIAVIVALVSGVVLPSVAWFVSRSEKSRARTEQFVTEKVQQVAETLADRLGDINNHLVSQDRKLDDARDRVSRIEGFIRRRE